MLVSTPTGRPSTPNLRSYAAWGCTKIFREKVTGARAATAAYSKMLDTLAPGDVVTVTYTDRLARGTFDLFAIVKPRRPRPLSQRPP
jgi:DNA invertase Pin-like site-specific DNA recombinase